MPAQSCGVCGEGSVVEPGLGGRGNAQALRVQVERMPDPQNRCGCQPSAIAPVNGAEVMFRLTHEEGQSHGRPGAALLQPTQSS